MNASTSKISNLIHGPGVYSASKISNLIDAPEVRSAAIVWIVSLLGTALLAFIVIVQGISPAWD